MRAFPHRRSTGFTLIEMLVAIAILSILVAILGTLLTGAQGVIDLSTRHITADGQARVVFDRMGNDLSHMVRAPGMDVLLSKSATPGLSDTMFFLSRASGHTGADVASLSPLSLVGYRINANFQLERLGKVLNWDTLGGGASAPLFNGVNTSSTLASSPTFAGVVGTSGNNYTDGTDPGYQVLADGVFRLSFFLLQTTTISTTAGTTVTTAYSCTTPSVPTTGALAGGTPLDYTTLAGATQTRVQTRAIVVALGILDATSRVHGVPSAQTVEALPDPAVATFGSSTNPSVAGSWNGLVQTSSFASTAGLTPQVAGQVRVYQRTFYLEGQSYQP